MFQRSSGILLHVTSLPGPYGIGSLGASARNFIDFLSAAQQSYWQILPLVPTGEGNSPYMSPSSAAGNPLLIDPDELYQLGLVTQEELNGIRYDAPDRVDYNFILETRPALLKKAWQRATPELLTKAEAFSAAHADWLPDYALFMACHDAFGLPLNQWPDRDLLHRDPEALARYHAKYADAVSYYTLMQYLFFRQWYALKEYANKKGIRIIGDIPFYVSGDSADVWCNPELFKLSEDFVPEVVAGVPPDQFSEDGQLWGNPIYNWTRHRADGYQWWCSRIRQSNAFYDVIRIDHFRGFDTYWEVPADAETALAGHWVEGPGQELLDVIAEQVPTAEFIAEDLGDLTESAVKFIRNSGLPGMRVLVDAFKDFGGSGFLPHHCTEGSVMYTGTHDTATFLEWLLEQATEDQRRYAMDYLRLNPAEGYGWGIISCAWSSICSLAMAPFQDVLGLGGDARMNAPGTTGAQNWSWRVRADAFNAEVAHKLSHITWLYGRT